MKTERTRHASAISAKAGIVDVIMTSTAAPRTSAAPTAAAVLSMCIDAVVDELNIGDRITDYTVGYNFVSDFTTTGWRNCSRDYSR